MRHQFEEFMNIPRQQISPDNIPLPDGTYRGLMSAHNIYYQNIFVITGIKIGIRGTCYVNFTVKDHKYVGYE